MDEHSNDLCLTSSFKLFKYPTTAINEAKINEMANLDCSKGWTVSFWIKVSNLAFFDKTILKTDNLNEFSTTNRINKNSKFFILKLSSFDIKTQFLYKKKLWTINQSIVWNSEWTMISLTWNEFEGLNLYMNDKKIICKQAFEYSAMQKDYLNYLNFFSIENISSEPGTIFIGFNGLLNKNNFNKKPFWSYRDEVLLMSSSSAEAIIMDELVITDYRLNSKEILSNYFKEYSIKSDFDSDEESVYTTSTDGKKSEVMFLKGAFLKQKKDKGSISNLF